MHIARWNKKRLAIVAIAIVALYIFFSSSYTTYQVDTVIKDSKPEEVWEYVADFSKMKLLNPLM
jgi:hypothetical protein